MIKKILALSIIGFWVIGTGFFIKSKIDFSFTPGKSSQFKSDFPMQSTLSVIPSKYNLYVFIHPKCGCSVATLDNLKSLAHKQSYLSDLMQIHVILYDPSESPKDWLDSQTVKDIQSWASQYPVIVKHDKSLQEFKLFDAQTSGQSFLFDQNRRLVFSGGLTEERGHAGPSSSVNYILSVLSNKQSSTNQRLPAAFTTDTFGCHSL